MQYRVPVFANETLKSKDGFYTECSWVLFTAVSYSLHCVMLGLAVSHVTACHTTAVHTERLQQHTGSAVGCARLQVLVAAVGTWYLVRYLIRVHSRTHPFDFRGDVNDGTSRAVSFPPHMVWHFFFFSRK